MTNLTLEEFNKLSEKEKASRYKELSDYDKFLVRISTATGVEVIGNSEVTKEEKKRADELLSKIEENVKKA